MNKVISIPIDKQSVYDLDHNMASETQLIEWKLSEEDYREFCELNLVSFINRVCNTLIDDFEDEKIYGESLCLLYDSISEHYDKNNLTIKKFLALIKEAINRDSLIWFFW